jgi:transcriptional regulator with XRE-family HTH domain
MRFSSDGWPPLIDFRHKGSENAGTDPGSNAATQRVRCRPERGKTTLRNDHEPRQATRRIELAAFLRARRARLGPADVGLVVDADARRRTPGLRREEVAQLSGVGVTWYTWLEQGRDILASSQVVDALARAMLLDPDEHQHLRDLSGLTAPERDVPVDGLLPRLQRLVDAVTPNVASVYDIHFDYLAWNTPYVRVRTDPGSLPGDRRNMVWMMFTAPGNRARMVRWEPAARAVLSQFRAAAGSRPGDPRFAEIVAALTEASPEFRTWWAEYPIRHFRPATIEIDHPLTGRVAFEIFQFRLAENPGLVMVMQVAKTSTDLERVTSLLAHPRPPA